MAESPSVEHSRQHWTHQDVALDLGKAEVVAESPGLGHPRQHWTHQDRALDLGGGLGGGREPQG